MSDYGYEHYLADLDERDRQDGLAPLSTHIGQALGMVIPELSGHGADHRQLVQPVILSERLADRAQPVHACHRGTIAGADGGHRSEATE